MERAGSDCTTPGSLNEEWLDCSVGTLRRTVWDGDQELIEIQVPYRLPGGPPQPDSILKDRILAFQERYQESATPFAWNYTRADIARLLARLTPDSPLLRHSA
jgi:hypothetical protein